MHVAAQDHVRVLDRIIDAVVVVVAADVVDREQDLDQEDAAIVLELDHVIVNKIDREQDRANVDANAHLN